MLPDSLFLFFSLLCFVFEVTAVGPPAAFQASPQNKEAIQTKTSPQNKEAIQISPQNIEAQGSVLKTKQSPPSNEAPQSSPQIKEAQRRSTVILNGPPPKLNKEHFNCKILQPTDDLNSKTNGIILSLAQQGRSLDEQYFEKASKTKQLTMVFTRPPPKRALKHATDCSQIQTPVQFDGQIRIRSWWFVTFTGATYTPTLIVATNIKPPITHELIAWATTKELGGDAIRNPASLTAKIKAVVGDQGRVDTRTFRIVGKGDFSEVTVLPNDEKAAIALMHNSGSNKVYFRIKSIEGLTKHVYETVWLDRKTSNEEAMGVLKAQQDMCMGLTTNYGKIGIRVSASANVEKVRKGAGKFAAQVYGAGLYRISGAQYRWSNRLQGMLLEAGLNSKFIRMEKGDFLVALDKSPKSQFLQCGETLMSIEKMELPEDQKQPKPAVQKYRDAKISYAEATKKTLQGNKQPKKQENKLPPSQGKTQELKKVEDGLKTMKERTDETLAKLQTEVADLQTRLDETMSKMTQIIEGLTNATKKNEEMIVKNYQLMLNAISQIATAVNKIEAKVGLSGTTHQVTANQNHCQND